jgi:hypothetical protein
LIRPRNPWKLAACGVAVLLRRVRQGIGSEVLLRRTPATILDRGTPLDNESD